MSKKRWFALLGSAVIFLVSVVSQVGTSLATTEWGNLLNEDRVSEKTIDKGTGNKKIAVAYLDGVIQDTGGDSLLSNGGNSYKKFMTMLDNAKEDKTVDGIIISVNSPGGGVVESADI